MIINFSPFRRIDEKLEVVKEGDKLTINRATFDFSVIPEGATLPAAAVDSDIVAGSIERVGGVLNITLRLPYDHVREFFPAPLVNPPDGLLVLPTPEK